MANCQWDVSKIMSFSQWKAFHVSRVITGCALGYP